MRNFIPKELRFSHKFAFLIHDLLAQNIAEGEKAKVFDTTFKFDSQKTARKIQKMSSEELWSWLAQNDKVAHYEVIYKHIFVALLSDFCHFVYEGLKCSEKGKLTVSYALFRKPFKDNLLILEWLLADPSDFMDKFYNEDSKIYNPQKLSPERKKEIIEKAIKETKLNLFDAEFIYDLRYNRSLPFSFSSTWDKANHLITSFEKIKTEKQNINFVFLSDESQYGKWYGIYSLLPVLLYHSFSIVECLFSTIAQRDVSLKDVAFDQCKAGFILWGNSIGYETKIKISNMSITGDCDECNQPIRMTGTRFLNQVFVNGFAKCKNCERKIYLSDF